MAQHPRGLSGYHRAPFHPDPLIAHADEESSSNVSPRSATMGRSPVSPLFHNVAASQDAEGLDFDEGRRPSSGPQRAGPVSVRKADKEKWKGYRATQGQPVHFEGNLTPDRKASRRRELLGMQGHRTQMLLQNRRATANLLHGQRTAEGDDLEVPPDVPPELSTAYYRLHNLIHENGPITIIPCTDLMVGSWRRIASSPAKHDLVAYVCEGKRCLTWFIHSEGRGFKMEIPLNAIIDTEFKTASPSSGLASFILSQPPIFYVENVSPRSDGSVVRTWGRCGDWTEGRQATHFLRHTLIGSAVQLAHVLRNLHSNAAMPGIAVAPPPVMPSSHRPDALISQPMDLPPLPLAHLSGANYGYPDPHGTETRYAADDDLQSPSHSASASTLPPLFPFMPTSQPVCTISNFEKTPYNGSQPSLHQGSGTSTLPAQPQLYYDGNPRVQQRFQHGHPDSDTSRPM